MIGRDLGDDRFLPRNGTAFGPPVAGQRGPAMIDVRDLVRSVLRHRWLVAVILAATVLAGVIITVLQDREYEAETTIVVSPGRSGSSVRAELQELTGIAALTGAGNPIATEAALLESRAVVEAVVDSLHLHVQLESPDVSHINVFRVLDAPRDAATGEFELERRDDGKFSLRATTPIEFDVPSVVRVGEPFLLGSVRLLLVPEIALVEASEFQIVIRSFQSAVSQIRSNLAISTSSGSNVLTVVATHGDSVLAAAIPNVIADRFFRFRTTLSRADASSAVAFLQEQVDNYAARLKQAEDELRLFRERADIVSAPDESSQQVRHLADLRARRDLLVAERDAIGSAIARAETGAPDAGSSSYRELASFPVFVSNGAVQSILRTLTELENQRSDLLTRRTPENDEVRRLTARIEELEHQLYHTARSYHEGLQNQIDALDESAVRFGSQLDRVPMEQVTLARLVREQQLLEQIYTLLQTRLKEAEIREVEDLSDARVLDAALVPRVPSSPRPLLNLFLAAVLGTMLGVGTALLLAVVDPRVRTRNDALAATHGLAVVGMIPHVSAPGNGRRPVRLPTIGRVLPAAGRADTNRLIVRHAPESPASEAYRALRTTLTFGLSEQPPRVITICSVAEGEGKSTSAANLAYTMAQQGFRTLLIDCDLRRPRVQTIFSLERDPGLVDVLIGRTSLADAAQAIEARDGGETLHVITAGTCRSSAAELIGSPAMRDLLDGARSRYDVVLLDAPPLAVASEAAVLGVLSDATLLIARATVTHKRALAEAVEQLQQLRIPLAGVVINDVEPSEFSYQSYGQLPVD